MTASAQKLAVEQMTVAGNDISASQYERKDLNGQACALVKVQLAAMGAQFEGNVIQPVEYKTGEYWVYMTEGTKELHIKHPSFVPLAINFTDYGIKGVVPKTTYVLTLSIPTAAAQNLDDGMRYLAMSVEPSNATVYIDNQPQVVQNGALSMLLSMGTHTYRVESPAYETQSGSFTVGNEKVTLPIRLKSTMATLTVSTGTAGTQIFINDQQRGTSSWQGTLPPGTYRVEGRLAQAPPPECHAGQPRTAAAGDTRPGGHHGHAQRQRAAHECRSLAGRQQDRHLARHLPQHHRRQPQRGAACRRLYHQDRVRHHPRGPDHHADQQSSQNSFRGC